MNAVTTLKTAESKLASAIAAVTAEVDTIGTSRIDGALADLEAAVARARDRLDAALAFMGARIDELTQTCSDMAAALERDAAETVPGNPPALTQDTPATAEPASVPPADTTQPEGTHETAEPDGIDLRDADGTDGATVPVNRLADLIGAEPSSNGHGKSKRRGQGRRRK